MIFGIGTDIVETSRLKRWVDSSLTERFFNQKEIELIDEKSSMQRKCEYFASRFAAKEAFSKALGTGLVGFDLKEVYTVKDAQGNPELKFEGRALEKLESAAGKNAVVHLSLSHEKEYALAFVIIERM